MTGKIPVGDRTRTRGEFPPPHNGERGGDVSGNGDREYAPRPRPVPLPSLLTPTPTYSNLFQPILTCYLLIKYAYNVQTLHPLRCSLQFGGYQQMLKNNNNEEIDPAMI